MASRRASRAIVVGVGAGALAATSVLYLPGWLPVGVALLAAALGGAGAVLRAPARRRAGAGAIALAVAASGLALADLVLRRALAQRLYYRPFEQYVGRWPVDPRTLRFDPDVDERRDVHGDLAAMSGDPALRQVRPMWFRTDARGFRNEGVPRGPLDVVLLGDSFGLGEGTTQEATWASLLSEAGLAVYNLSMPGSPAREALTLAWEAPRLPLREGTVLVWALFAGNDLWDEYPEWSPPLEPLPWLAWARERVRQVRQRSPLRLLVAPGPRTSPGSVVRASHAGGPFLFFGPYVEEADVPLARLQARDERAGLDRALRRARSVARGLRVLVVVVPSKAEVYRDVLGPGAPRRRTAFSTVVHEACAAAGLPVLDLMPTFLAEREREPGALLWWRDDTHWSPRGHAVAARAVLARLAAEPGLAPHAAGPPVARGGAHREPPRGR